MKVFTFKVQGMTCQSCEVLIEDMVKELDGVTKVSLSFRTGRMKVITDGRAVTAKQIHHLISDHGYHVSDEQAQSTPPYSQERESVDIGELIIIALIIGIVFIFLRGAGIIDPGRFSITNGASYGVIFLVGLLAASSSCIAVAGGLLLSSAATYHSKYPDASRKQKFAPHLLFNVGRIVSYTLFGGLIGLVGKAVTIPPQVIGLLMVLASAVMVAMGLKVLRIVDITRYIHIPVPKIFARLAHQKKESASGAAPFLLGASTFFLPCGFTQALQVYVLTTGSFTQGALTMLVFTLGTAPALLSLGALTSVTRGIVQKYVMKFAGVFVVMIGLFTIQNGMALAGFQISFPESNSAQNGASAEVKIENGVQIVEMAVTRRGYEPNQFIIQKGIPVKWKIDGQFVYGCQAFVTVPSLGLSRQIDEGANVIEFTPNKTGKIAFMCSMGMYRGTFNVVDAL